MGSGRNGILIGVIVILVGVMAISGNLLRLDAGYLTLMCAGFALLLLYKTKKKSWSLIVGGYALVFGILGLASKLSGVSGGAFYMIGVGMLFIVPAMIYLILFCDKNKRALLAPGSFLLWIGMYVSSFAFAWFARYAAPMSLIYAGCAFFTVYLLDGASERESARNIGVILGVLGAAFLAAAALGMKLPARWLRYSRWVVVCAGVVIILKALRRR
ncbi:MAG: hypothetical protein LBL35_05605 [Clostridiales bacterium]|jgi:hypothetical protein|nr:hypothetical protein [Clostridiales bacterium]